MRPSVRPVGRESQQHPQWKQASLLGLGATHWPGAEAWREGVLPSDFTWISSVFPLPLLTDTQERDRGDRRRGGCSGLLPWPAPTSQSPGSPACGGRNAQGGILRLGALASSPFHPPSINQSKYYREFPCAPWRAGPTLPSLPEPPTGWLHPTITRSSNTRAVVW